MILSKIRIQHLFGLKEFSSDGKSLELSGKNGVGKSAVVDALKLCLTNKSPRDYVITKGQEKGEVYIETTTGLKIHRKFHINKADYKSIKEGTDKSEKTEAFLREFFTELQLNPLDFANMTEQEQNRIILDLIDFKWDINWIKEQFGEIPPDVNFDQNILCVLHDIQAENGYYFKHRQDVNREARTNQAFIEEIGATLPKDYNAAQWEKKSLGELYKKIETIQHKNGEIEKAKEFVKNRDNKMRGFVAEYEVEKSAIDKETIGQRHTLEKQIQDLENKIKEYKTQMSTLEDLRIEKLKAAKSEHEANIATMEGEFKNHAELAKLEVTPCADLQEEAENAEKMKGFVNEYKRMVELKVAVDKLGTEANDLTAKIEKARTLPGEILQNSDMPLEGLTIKDGVPLINGLPVSNLSEGEKFELCISIATKNSDSLQLLLLDGVERLASPKRAKIYANLKRKGVQFIATRTTDEELLTVIQL